MAQFVNQIKNRKKFIMHLRTALIVGILLNAINQGDNFVHLNFSPINFFKVALTFFVPFAVSVYSAAKTNPG
ncbi:MAG: hypothetical protein COW85_05115 [Ignavibacteria bacterium CG22_combo_CG10-13_8_21_14_all_37_15]|nr:MAG: hypothetical protein COW85_05115 [Ignavibacteria bacterium CG22_combo_CG10-13_8_21_14_all_37_15]